MLDRVIDRLPAVLLILVLALLAHVAFFDVNKPAKLVAGIPAVVVLLLYLRAGTGKKAKAAG